MHLTINLQSRFISSFFFLFIAENVMGQDNGPGAWYIYNGMFMIRPKTEIFFETQFRLREPMSNKEEIYFRPIFIYHINSTWNAGLGYTYHINFYDGNIGANEKSSHENRIILQGQLNSPVKSTRIQHRFRLEQRWITSTSSAETITKQRFRYRFQATIPVGNQTIEKGVFFINLYNELFLNLRTGTFFDQNRIYAAPGYQLTKSTNLQIGYLFQIRGNERNHRLQFFLTQRLIFYKD